MLNTCSWPCLFVYPINMNSSFVKSLELNLCIKLYDWIKGRVEGGYNTHTDANKRVCFTPHYISSVEFSNYPKSRYNPLIECNLMKLNKIVLIKFYGLVYYIAPTSLKPNAPFFKSWARARLYHINMKVLFGKNEWFALFYQILTNNFCIWIHMYFTKIYLF